MPNEKIVTPIEKGSEYRSMARRKNVDIHSNRDHDNASYGSGNGGGGDMLEPRVARLESDVSYIKRDIEKIQNNVDSIDKRLTSIESSISTMRATIKYSGLLISVTFGFCTYIFGSYISRVMEALNTLVLKQ